ncbi:MAG: carbon-nitrogen hydrolase family protein [Candidatus Bathyarchaeia archaeon]
MGIKIVKGELAPEKIPKTPAKLLIPQEKFTIALCQLASEVVEKKENWDANLEKAIECIEEAAKAKADLVVFPEMYMCNYMAQHESRYFAEPVPGPTTEKLADVAKKNDIYIIIGMPVMVKGFPGLVKNSAAVIGPEGIMGEYSKSTLPTFRVPPIGLITEGNHWTPGLRFPVFKMRSWTVGINICQDCLLPETSRIYALQGAQLIVTISAGPSLFKDAWGIMLPMRALENAVFQAYCNVVGTFRGVSFFGGNRVIAPTGDIIVQGPIDEEAIVIGTMDINVLYEARCSLPILRPGYDLQPYLYELITKPARYE